jgi:PPOX class probable F420-dependent enzyme
MNVQDVLKDKIAQELLTSTELARLAYTWRDGTPRVVPIWFHWTGSEVVVSSPLTAPKMKVLEARPDVALTIDHGRFPYRVLLIRGRAKVEPGDGVVPEYAAAANRYLGPVEGAAWLDNVKKMGLPSARIAVTPTYARVLDFETRFPSAIAAAIEGAQAGQ